MALLAIALVAAVGSFDRVAPTLITGAGGRTGSLLYAALKSEGRAVRAFVRTQEKAREYLNCTSCDETEGIYVGDVTDPAALKHAASGVSAAVVCAGVSGNESTDVVKAVEYGGVQNTLAALAQPTNVAAHGLASLRMVLLSSMGTSKPDPDPSEGGSILFYKLQAEAFVMSSGVPFAF